MTTQDQPANSDDAPSATPDETHNPVKPAESSGVGPAKTRPPLAQGVDTGSIQPGASSQGDAQNI